jgi:frataxin-like iron-binding protein CyaY
MLKNRYQEILVGMGLVSLVRGIISLKRNRSTLLIDDKRFTVDSYPGHFLSELEILSLLRLGKKYEIPELVDLRQFLVPARIDLVTNERRIKIGEGPLSNIKEMLRKYPELLDHSDLDQVYEEQDEVFNKYFISELTRYESQNQEASMRPKGYHFDLQGSKWVKTFYQRFGDLLNQEYQESKSLKYSGLLHLLGIAHEEKLKTTLGAEEIPYYFFRTFSPIYRLQDFFLATQLKRRLVLLGGDYKESSIQFWQFFNNKFENLLLESFEGVISGERVLFFSHIPEEVPFKVISPYPVFRKTQFSPAKRMTAPFPPNCLTYLADMNLLGSERPYRVLAKGNDFSFYHWPYPDLPGSKPKFYENDLKEAFTKDSMTLPFQNSPVEVTPTGSVTLDLRPLRANKKSEAPVLKRLPLSVGDSEHPIRGFEYWGPFRYRSFGLLALSYGIEGF